MHNPTVQAAVAALNDGLGKRKSAYAARAAVQAGAFEVPKFPATTIGSFPQAAEIRKARSDFRAGKPEEATYTAAMRQEIERAVREQEKLCMTCSCTARPSATTWPSTSASSSKASSRVVRYLVLEPIAPSEASPVWQRLDAKRPTALPFERMIVSHGEPVHSRAAFEAALDATP